MNIQRIYKNGLYFAIGTALLTAAASSPADAFDRRLPSGAGLGIGVMCGFMTEGIARQPNAAQDIVDLGVALSEIMLSRTRGLSLGKIPGEANIGIGILGGQAAEGIARQPDEKDKIMPVALACAETIQKGKLVIPELPVEE